MKGFLWAGILSMASSLTARAGQRSHFKSQTELGYRIDISENAPRDVPAMEEWANACGVQRADSLHLASVDGDGVDVCAVTSQDLPASSPVLFVPQEMILSSNKAIAELRSEEMEQAEKLVCSVNADSELRHYYLMLKIIVEYEKGEASPWYPWLNSLPRYYSNAASMTPLCYQCLPSLMKKLAMEERANLNHLTVKKVPFLSVETKGNGNLWTWAYQVVYTRAFETEDGDLRIVPMGDYFNHGSDYTEIVYGYDEEGNYLAQTSFDVPAGSPLRISYGDPTNPSFLFARYGFFDESSPATFCKLFPPHINKDMKDLGYAQNRMLFYKDTGEVSQEVWDILLYQFLSSTKVGDRRKLMKAHLEDDWETKRALHEEYYPKTSSLLLDHIDTFVEQLDRLSAKSEGKDFIEHPRLPLILRHNAFVRQTFLTVRNHLLGQQVG